MQFAALMLFSTAKHCRLQRTLVIIFPKQKNSHASLTFKLFESINIKWRKETPWGYILKWELFRDIINILFYNHFTTWVAFHFKWKISSLVIIWTVFSPLKFHGIKKLLYCGMFVLITNTYLFSKWKIVTLTNIMLYLMHNSWLYTYIHMCIYIWTCLLTTIQICRGKCATLFGLKLIFASPVLTHCLAGKMNELIVYSRFKSNLSWYFQQSFR